MTPSPNELVEGMRQLLRSSIGPELQSDQARADLRKIMAVLREVDWNDAAHVITDENDALERLIVEIGADPPRGVVAPGFDAARQRNLACRIVLAAFIDASARQIESAVTVADLTTTRVRLARALADIARRRGSRRKPAR